MYVMYNMYTGLATELSAQTAPKLDKQTERAEFNKQTQYFDCTAHTCGHMDRRTGRQRDKRTDKAYERVCQELVHVS